MAPYLVSDAQLVELGLTTWSRLTERMAPTADRQAQQQVADVAARLLPAAGESPDRWEVRVFARDEVNAFVLPGRKIGVFEGMLRLAEGEGELAAVIGHEIGHLKADHSRARISADIARQWGMQLIYFLLNVNDVAFAQEIAALLGIGAEFGLVRPYGRAQELEADRLGLFMMAKAGYDPREAVELWTRMEQLGGSGPAILSTHPAPRDRIAALRAIVPEAIKAARG